jgi:hypothetical protein
VFGRRSQIVPIGRVAKLQLVGDPAADALLDDNPMALLIGLLLDQDRAMPKTLPVVDIPAPVFCCPVAAGPLDDDAALEIAMRLKASAQSSRFR